MGLPWNINSFITIDIVPKPLMNTKSMQQYWRRKKGDNTMRNIFLFGIKIANPIYFGSFSSSFFTHWVWTEMKYQPRNTKKSKNFTFDETYTL